MFVDVSYLQRAAELYPELKAAFQEWNEAANFVEKLCETGTKIILMLEALWKK